MWLEDMYLVSSLSLKAPSVPLFRRPMGSEQERNSNVCSSRLGLIEMDHRSFRNGRNSQQ